MCACVCVCVCARLILADGHKPVGAAQGREQRRRLRVQRGAEGGGGEGAERLDQGHEGRVCGGGGVYAVGSGLLDT